MSAAASSPTSRLRELSLETVAEQAPAAPATRQDEGVDTLEQIVGIVSEARTAMLGMTTTFREKAEVIACLAPQLIKAEMFHEAGSKHFFKMVFDELKQILWFTDQVLAWHRNGQFPAFEVFTAASEKIPPQSFYTALVAEKHIDLTRCAFHLPLPKPKAQDVVDHSRTTLAALDNAEKIESASSVKLNRDDLIRIAERIKKMAEGLEALAKRAPSEAAGLLTELTVEVLSLNMQLYAVAPRVYDKLLAPVLLDGMAASHVACTSWVCAGFKGTLVEYVQATTGERGRIKELDRDQAVRDWLAGGSKAEVKEEKKSQG